MLVAVGRFDLSFKSLAETSPLTLLRLFAHQSVAGATIVEPLDREVVMSIKSVDHAFLIERDGQRWIEHFEAELILSAEDRKQVLNRAVSMAIKMNLPVWTTIILLSRRHGGRTPPYTLQRREGGVTLTVKPKIVALWRMSPSLVLGDATPEGLPLVGAMNPTESELDAAVSRLGSIEDKELRSRLTAEFLTWGDLNYSKMKLAALRSRIEMVTTKEILMATSFGEELIEHGQIAEARKNVLMVSGARFPKLLNRAKIEEISDLKMLRNLSRAILAADSLPSAKRAIHKILPGAK